jgi:SAM-dependent methyltransferase
VGSGRVVCADVTPDERWLDAMWPFVHAQLPAPPARVVEVGCGPLGGFVPMLHSAGYDATGVDPEAPQGPGYSRVEFERHDLAGPADAIVASVSLHHVADLGEVLDLAEAALVPGGVLVVVEWARERFDEATARWCFGRLPPPGDGHDWLRERSAQWRDSGLTWDAYCRSWAEAEGLHTGDAILAQLRARFGSGLVSYGPYFFPDLPGTSEADEQAAIDSGQIQANRIQYVGRRGTPRTLPSA